MSANHHHTSEEDYILSLYEGDQSKLYSGVYNHHAHDSVDSPESKKKIKAIWGVTAILAIVTIIEVGIGLWVYSKGAVHGGLHWFVIIAFLALTIYKSAKIVMTFMHLGDERNFFKNTILLLLTIFIWFIIAFLADGAFWLHMNQTSPVLN